MDINGCHIVSSLNADSFDGFSSTVSRYVGFRQLPNPVPDGAVKISRGPFVTINEAIQYAQTWNDASNPPPMPEGAKPSEKSADPPANSLAPETPANTPSTDVAATEKTDPTITANAK